MEVLLSVLIVVDVLATAAVLVVALVNRPRNDASAQAALVEAVRSELRQSGVELRQDLSTQRTELLEQLSRDREERQASQAALRNLLAEQFGESRKESQAQLEKVREAVGERLQATLTTSLQNNAERIEALTRSNAEKQDELKTTLRVELDKLRKENEEKLEKMRLTVDEKLHDTLEKRLGESFQLVSGRLEEVQKGLGEMQTLAQDVGGLKRVLTNVKSRGGWGEVRLAAQLEDVLSPDQYAANVKIKPGSNEVVEYAVKLPGRDDNGDAVYLPIDSKFPQEDYDRLLDAQEKGDKIEIDRAETAFERAILEQAKKIASKYIEPPISTDFAIMYLPTEGLFAEVVRRPGLADRLQKEHRVQVSGPSTLAAFINSLNLGFRTLQIEKRSSEVWKLLSAAKLEFRKYGDVWARLEKQLQTAQNTVTEAGRRTRAVERKLRAVETPQAGSEEAKQIESLIADFDEGETTAEVDDEDVVEDDLVQ